MATAIDDLKHFLDHSPTALHAVKEIATRLALKDYIPLQEADRWHLEAGKNYFVSRNGSFCAFRMPSQIIEQYIIFAAHTDSPSLKIKPNPEITKDNMSLLATEVYGGPLLSSWLNRDLGIAGKIVIKNKTGAIEEKLIFIDETPLSIPQLAIHLDRDVNEKGPLLNKQEHLQALVGLNLPKGLVLQNLLRKRCSFDQLLSFDLFLTPIEQARCTGMNGEFLSSYRIDNLASVHAATTAFGSCIKSPKHTLQMMICWDHEEIGSKTWEGAYGTFFDDIRARIIEASSMTVEQDLIAKSKSLCISLDMAHAMHPGHEARHDPQHTPLLGKGIAVKYNASHKYATSASSAAFIHAQCQSLYLQHQSFTSRSDMSCGSTVGPISAHHLGIETVDIGCPQLSMHSAREMLACQDYTDMCVFLTHLIQNERV